MRKATMKNNSKELSILLEFGRILSQVHDLDKLLINVADYAKKLVDADRCSVFVYDEKKHELFTKVAHGVSEIRISADQGIVGLTAKTKEIQIITDPYDDIRFSPETDRKTGYLTKNILAIPLLDSNENIIGVFQAINKIKGVFTSFDIDMLVLIANQASGVLEKAILFKKIIETQEKIITKLSIATGYNDDEVAYHPQRVGLYSELIAKAIGLDQTTSNLLLSAAPMHDAGMVGVPEYLIKKKDKLAKDEFILLMNHTIVGYKILYDEDDELLKTAAIIAKEHHEKYDGTGYPDGLRGEEISIYARITAVADVFDSLTVRASNKQSWTIEKSLSFLEHMKNRHFDPTLVDAFIEKKDEIIEIFSRYSYE